MSGVVERRLKSGLKPQRREKGNESASDRSSSQPQVAIPPNAPVGAQTQQFQSSVSAPPISTSGQLPGAPQLSPDPALQASLLSSSRSLHLGESFEFSREPKAAGSAKTMTSGMNSTLMQASTVTSSSSSMPLLKKATIKPSIAVKLGQKYTKLFEQIRALEILYSSLYTQVDLYHVRSAVLRNTGDEVALMFAMLARVSGPTFKTSLEQTARSVGVVQDYRHAEILRLKSKVLDTLAKYGPKLKQIKSDMKRLEKAILAEQKARVAYNKKLSSSNPPAIVEKARASHQVKLGVVEQQKKSFDAMISEFESSRLDTLKTFMKDFLHLEMVFHAKVLDFYTAAYKSVDDMHPDIDFADFKRVFLENAIDAPMGLQGTQAFGATANSSTLGAMSTGFGTMSSTGPGVGVGGSNTGPIAGASGSFGAARAPAAGASAAANNLEYDDEYTDEDEDEDVELEDYDDTTTGSVNANAAGTGAGVRMGSATVPPPGARPAGQAAFNGGSTASSMTVTTSSVNRSSYR